MTNTQNDKTRQSGSYDHNAYPTASVLRTIAADLVGASGADVERLLRDARQRARRQRRKLTYSDIQRAIDETRSPLTPEMLWRRSVHEAGHVIARLKLKLGDVELATVNGAGGRSYVESSVGIYEMQTEQDLSNSMIIILAGRAAEQMVLGIPCLGSGGSAESDLARATEIAKDLETRLGCSGLWPLTYRRGGDFRFFDPGMPVRIHERLSLAYENALSLLQANRSLMITLANHLRRSITIDGPTLRKILDLPATENRHKTAPKGMEFSGTVGGRESNTCNRQNDYFSDSGKIPERRGTSDWLGV